MKKAIILLGAALPLVAAAMMLARANLHVGSAFAIIPQGGGDIVLFPGATFTNDDPTLPLFLTDAQNLMFHGNTGPVELHDFTLATDIAVAGVSGLEVAPGQTLYFTGENGNPGLLSVSDDNGPPSRYQPGLNYTATYDLTYHYAGGNDVKLSDITVAFSIVPEPGSFALLGSAALVGGLLLRRRRTIYIATVKSRSPLPM